MRKLVTGEIGVSNYDDLTWAEVALIIQGYNDRVIGAYKQTRLLMFIMVKMWGDQKSSPNTVEEFWNLPGDEMTPELKEEEIKAIFDNLKKAEK